MKIQTLQFGELTINQEEILHFPEGIFGFPTEKQFYLFSHPDHAPFMWMQSVQTPHLAFVVLDPWVVISRYEFTLADDIQTDLKINDKDQVMILGIVTVPEDSKETTINLRAPLIINVAERLAKQYILPDDDYDVRYQVFSS